MALVPKNKFKGGKKQSSRNGKGFNRGASATTKSAHPTVISQKQRVSPEGADTVLPYCQTYYLSSAGSYQAQQFRMNSPHDFDYTGTGEQPDGYDQWTAFFTLYKCYKTEIEVTIIPTTKAIGLVFYASPNTTVASTLENALSQKVSVGVTCGVYETRTVRKTITMPNFFGADFSEFGSSLYGASVGSNPAANCYGTVDCFNIDASAVLSCYIVVKAKLYVTFTSPGYLAISLNDKREVKEVQDNQPKHNIASCKCCINSPTSECLSSKGVGEVSATSSVVSKPQRTIKEICAEFDIVG